MRLHGAVNIHRLVLVCGSLLSRAVCFFFELRTIFNHSFFVLAFTIGVIPPFRHLFQLISLLCCYEVTVEPANESTFIEFVFCAL